MHVVAFTGAGISAESGLATFRGQGGLWENHPVQEVASPQAFARNPELVMRFYNARRKQLQQVEPNPGHLALAAMERFAKVTVVTQNVDDLHERAGSSNVIHLHGELMKVRTVDEPWAIYDWPGDLNVGQKDAQGRLLRPHIVWFGEMVPKMDEAVAVIREADVFVVCGTSLQVYPAAGLVFEAPVGIPKYYVDPEPGHLPQSLGIETIADTASQGLPKLMEVLKGRGKHG